MMKDPVHEGIQMSPFRNPNIFNSAMRQVRCVGLPRPIMTPHDIISRLHAKLGDNVFEAYPDDKHPRVHIDAAHLRSVAEFLRHDPVLKLDWLANYTGIDYVADGKMCVVLDLFSVDWKHTFAVKAYCPRENPHVPTVADLWPAADWHEREAFDLFGICIDGHPDLRRILLSDDWVGHPLRKDYVFPREYHGIPGSVELDWQQKPGYPE
jgi:NADH-quinone oxidoreductase subunit C